MQYLFNVNINGDKLYVHRNIPNDLQGFRIVFASFKTSSYYSSC